jgi:hypothetical protein
VGDDRATPAPLWGVQEGLVTDNGGPELAKSR